MSQCTHGVDIGYRGPRAFRLHDNWPSAYRNWKEVQASIQKDIDLGIKAGPFSQPPFTNFVGSPMGAYKKKHSSKFRVIHDLSWPPGGSVNDYIDADDYHVNYMSVDDVVEKIRVLGTSCKLAKLDLADAFKHIPVRVEDWELLGSTWYLFDENTNSTELVYFYDKVLQFGARSSPKLFNDFANAANSIMLYRGVTYCDHYLDDFVTVGPRDSVVCKNNLELMLEVCAELGFAVNPAKVVMPSTTMEFLGLILDTNAMQIRISDQRLSEIMSELELWGNRKVCKKRELLSLIGKLMFVSRVVRPGRSFVRRMIDLSKRVKHLHYKVKLNVEFQRDVDWWLQYLPSWNGVKMIMPSTIDHHVFTDASDLAISGYWEGKWFVQEFVNGHEDMLDMCINWRELCAVVTAAATYGAQWRGAQVLFHCDNVCVVQILNSGSCKNAAMMELIRKLFFISATYEFELRSIYISTSDNIIADALSRLKFNMFRREVPDADIAMSQINLVR